MEIPVQHRRADVIRAAVGHLTIFQTLILKTNFMCPTANYFHYIPLFSPYPFLFFDYFRPIITTGTRSKDPSNGSPAATSFFY